MRNSLLFLLLALLISCGDNKPKSGKSEINLRKEKEAEIPTADLGLEQSVLDTTTPDAIHEMQRQRLKAKSEKVLSERISKEVSVSGTIIGGGGMTITLDKLGGERNVEPIVTTIINQEGVFELEAMTSQEQIYNLRTDSGNMILYLGVGGNYTLTADANDIQGYKVDAPLSYKVRDFFYLLNTHNAAGDKIAKRQERYTKEKKAWKVKRVLDSMEYYNDIMEKARAEDLKNFINNNRGEAYAAEVANRLDYLKHTKFIEDLYNELVVKFPYSSYVKNVGLKLIRYKVLALGKEAPEMVMQNIDEQNIRLSDQRGKYTLVFFTVNYDTRSHEMATKLKSFYHQFNSRNFEVYNVVMDESKDEWGSYLDTTQAPWIVVSDILGAKSTALDYYLAPTYPMTYLIDPNGILIQKYVNMDELEKLLLANK